MANLGLQLYTLRELMKEDFVGILKRVAEIGYEGVEFAGYGGIPTDELRDILSELKLQPVSSHISLDDLEKNLDAVVQEARTLGVGYIVCPWFPKERRSKQGYIDLAKFFTEVGNTCKDAGLKFAYHNHEFEFEDYGGKCGLDLLFEHSDPEVVQAELDVYWIEYAGQSATEYIRKYANRCDLIHAKDMANDTSRAFAEVGSGRLDFDHILETGRESNVAWFLVEQDECRGNPLDAVKKSFEFLHKRLGAERSCEN